MRPNDSIGTKLLRLMVALFGFISALCVFLYLGFGLKFDPTNPSAPKASKDQSKTFYTEVGRTVAPASNEIPESLAEKFTLELKVLTSKAETERLIDQLGSQGVKAYYTPFQSHGKVFYRVRQGVYSSKETAQAQAEQLKLAKNLPVTVIKLR